MIAVGGQQDGNENNFDFSRVLHFTLSRNRIQQNLARFVLKLTALQSLKLYPRSSEVIQVVETVSDLL